MVEPSALEKRLMRGRLLHFYGGLESRSLGLFRILLGASLVWDWIQRWPNIEAFYTAFGVATTSAGEFRVSLLDGVTSLPMAQVFFCAGLAAYGLFVAGYRTRLFHLISFLFYLSVLNRNGLVVTSSDTVRVTMLLWGLFLPMGARFSLDARRKAGSKGKGRRGKRKEEGAVGRGGQGCSAPDGRGVEAPAAVNVGGASALPTLRDSAATPVSLAAFAIVFQIAVIYFCSALTKSGVSWREGTAVYYALQMSQYASATGAWLAQQPLWLLKALTWTTLAVHYAAAPLILCPFWQPRLRRVAIAGLCAMHAGIWLTMELGEFQFLMIACCALLLMAEDWQRIEGWSRGARASGFIGKLLGRPAAPLEANGSDTCDVAGRRGGWKILSNAVVGVILAAVMVCTYNYNLVPRLKTARLPEPWLVRAIVRGSHLNPNWALFAPDPAKRDGWWVMDGVTESGESFDPMTGEAVSWRKPDGAVGRLDRFWRRYLGLLTTARYQDARRAFCQYVARANHRRQPPGQRLARFDLYYVWENTPPPGSGRRMPRAKTLLAQHDCGEARTNVAGPKKRGGRGPAIAPDAKAGHWMVLDRGEMDFGNVDQGVESTRSLVFRNKGPGVLKILDVGSSCGCAVAMPDVREVPPGGSGQLKVTFKAGGLKGPVRKTVTIRTNDPGAPAVTVGVTANVHPVFALEPPVVNLGEIERGKTLTCEVTIREMKGRPFAIRQVLTTNPELKAEVAEAALETRPGNRASRQENAKEPGSVLQKVLLTLDAKRNSGPFTCSAHVEVERTNAPRLTILVTGTVVGPVRVSPSALFLGQVSQGGKFAPKKLTVTNTGLVPVEIQSVETGYAGLRATVTTVAPGREFQIEVAAVEMPPPGVFQRTMRIRTSESAVPIEVNLGGIVRKTHAGEGKL